jgi:hypothetical protein
MLLKAGVVLACCWVVGQAHADMLGARLGLDYWQARPLVTAGDPGLAGRFSLADTNELAWTARFEHPVPLLPNVAARHQQSTLSGQGHAGPKSVCERSCGNTNSCAEEY